MPRGCRRRGRVETSPVMVEPVPRRDEGSFEHFVADHSAWILASLVLLALAVRVIGLDQGLWLDETLSIHRAFRGSLSTILTSFPSENDHPLYSVLAHLCIAAFGESAWSVRLPAVLFGVATVPALWALGREVASRAEALAASAILAVSYHHVWFSQNARGYTATALFATLGAWLLLRGVASGSRRDFVAYGVVTALGAYTHLTMVFVSLGHAAALGIFAMRLASERERETILRLAPLGFAVAAAGTVALYLPRATQVLRTFGSPTVWVGTASPSWAVIELLRGLARGWGAGFALLGVLAVALGSLVFLAGLAAFWRERPLFVLLVVLPPLVLFGGSMATRGVLYPRFFFFAIGIMLLVAVHGLAATGRLLARSTSRPALRGAVPAAGVGLALVASLAALPHEWRTPKQDYEGAIRWLHERSKPGEQILLPNRGSPFLYFYSQPWVTACKAEEIAAARQSGPVWIVWSMPYQIRAICPDFMEVADRECPSPKTFPSSVHGGEIRVCHLGGSPDTP